MTNPNNIVRVRARNGGRASVYEANGWAQAFSTGILDGTGVTPNTTADMTVLVGGSSTKPDVLIAQNPAGYKIALDIVGQQGVTITAPSTNSRISSIVAYTDDLALSTTEDNTTGSPSSCGLIVVNGASAASPSAPDEATIRSAITADGAVGSQASYVVIANITVSSATTAITSTLIEKNKAGVTSQNIDWATAAQIVDTQNNGTAVKFGNGLMIAYISKADSVRTDATYAVTTWTYPVAFIEKPAVQAQATRNSGGYNMLTPRENAISPTSAQITWTGSNAANTVLANYMLIAIGKWK